MWDGILVINFGNAWLERKNKVTDFYLKRVRPELREAIEAWLATKPLENPNAPPHPIAMPIYAEKVTSKINAEINAYKQAVQKATDRANRASGTSDKYVLMTVLLASVLFFEAVSSRFKAPKIANSLLVIAFLMFAAIAGVLATFPIAQS
jgi:C1A family cysteine protease